MDKILDRILKQIDGQEIIDKLLSLPKADLNSLLLHLFGKQTDSFTPVDVLKAYQSNRFSVPSDLDPVRFHALEAELLAEAQRSDMQTILLSPSATLGSCSVFGCVDQYNVVSGLRGTETLSDPTNMLAIIIAEKLKTGTECNVSPLHYATTARAVRSQVFSGKGFFAHFGLFCMVSSGKDTGAYSCEKQLLKKQLLFYKQWMQDRFHTKLSLVLSKRDGYKDGDGFCANMIETVRAVFPETPISLDESEMDNKYYQGVNFKIFMESDGEKIFIGDGGFVDWISRMLGNKKERCLISGVGLDRFILFGK